MKNKITSILFIMVFLSLTIANAFYPQVNFSENENRFMQQLPQFTVEKLLNGEFGTQFEKYTTDQFIFRDTWISMKTMSELALQKRDNGRVYFGEDNFLFELNTTVDKGQLDKNIAALNTFVSELSTKHPQVNTSIMIAPTAAHIYEEKLPKNAPVADQQYIIDTVKNNLLGNVQFHDPSSLLKEKSNDYIYYKTDHHWTTLGAYYAYTKWAEETGIIPLSLDALNKNEISNTFYGTTYSKANLYSIPADTMYSYTPKESITFKMDINQGEKQFNDLYDPSYIPKKDKYSYFIGGNNAIVDIQSNVKNGKTLMVIKDSYAHSFIPFAANHYEHVIVLDLRYMRLGVLSMIEEYEVDDVLVLYNTVNFSTDRNFVTITK